MLQWTIRRRLPKPDMAGHGSVSETGKVSVTDEGLASRRWLKVQSDPRGNPRDKPTDLDNSGLATRAGESLQVHFENLGLPGYHPDKIFLHIRSTSKLEIRTGSARILS